MDLRHLLFILALICANDSLSASDDLLQRPQISKCRSPEMETFSCFWTAGNVYNLTVPRILQLLYKKSNEEDWKECPDYITSGQNSCYFNASYTSVWTPYCVQLASKNEIHDKKCFSVDEIVLPDPPVHLNWTLLNTSQTGIHGDIQVRWDPPPTADVRKGWITLEYELQYKEVNETKWKELKPRLSTVAPLYSLKTARDYEIRIRSRQRTSEKFGEFSEILYVSFSQLGIGCDHCTEEVEFPWFLVVVFGVCGLAVTVISIMLSKQPRLKMLIFPPVPVPKIKGIDPDLLKKGKLDEVNSILACHDIYKTQLYSDDLWVEFIELDIEDPDEKNRASDTDRLLSEDHLKSHNCLGAKDDDSGRASCCEPDIPETDFSASDTCDATSDSDQFKKAAEREEDLLCLDRQDNDESLPSLANTDPQGRHRNTQSENSLLWASFGDSLESPRLSVHTQMSNQNSLTSTDFYAQVSDITPAGRVVLSPGQKSKLGRAQREGCTEQNFTVDNTYFCEADVKKCIAVTSHEENEPRVQEQGYNEDGYFTTESLTTTVANFGASTAAAPSSETPVADYTSIHIVQSPQGLVLNATALPLPDKEFNVSCGYVSTDQLNKIMP
ncbi:growth hormone receptor [Oenanthe melanoleuca]|nr:growth hormone receptor [Oenanthe melanoleuca]XP_056369079.1 growth hormone receptor [Oenanthe melanoleuca]XP_056369080.1 growth hormone receptor [Oenanthe melanoleuca]XP_056369081.1 growth hormone receptor [Oenanthe melanoleuca]XP_056369082.1 growth hormone receptor [Oenanthe melanoleuca]XP_056369083.1 growth hormone receptor [Oenanthe melanoleuca]XP_056369084.1 growth hormone receptor [Oenanthe melanoleuca]